MMMIEKLQAWLAQGELGSMRFRVFCRWMRILYGREEQARLKAEMGPQPGTQAGPQPGTRGFSGRLSGR